MTPAEHPAIWLRLTPGPRELETMPESWFHAAIDKLKADTVPESYWKKVRASQQAKELEAR